MENEQKIGTAEKYQDEVERYCKENHCKRSDLKNLLVINEVCSYATAHRFVEGHEGYSPNSRNLEAILKFLRGEREEQDVPVTKQGDVIFDREKLQKFGVEWLDPLCRAMDQDDDELFQVIMESKCKKFLEFCTNATKNLKTINGDSDPQ